MMKAKQIVPLLKELIEDGTIKINVNVTEYTNSASGQFNGTKTTIVIGDEHFEAGSGVVYTRSSII